MEVRKSRTAPVKQEMMRVSRKEIELMPMRIGLLIEGFVGRVKVKAITIQHIALREVM